MLFLFYVFCKSLLHSFQRTEHALVVEYVSLLLSLMLWVGIGQPCGVIELLRGQYKSVVGLSTRGVHNVYWRQGSHRALGEIMESAICNTLWACGPTTYRGSSP